MIALSLQVACTETPLPTEAQFSDWLLAAEKMTPKKIPESQRQITIRLVSPEESQQLNETYRHKTGPTNVLSFPPSDIPGFTQDTLGDLAICAAIVKAEAAAQHKTLTAHWAHMVVHGFLHLMGYDHIEDDEAETMENLESQIMHRLQFDDPYTRAC